MERSIDLVIPMVFPQDPEWQREYAKARGIQPAANATGVVAGVAAGVAAGAVTHVRYRSWGTEELLIRCCMKYMPWVRTIHILLASESQVQPWMAEMAAVVQQHTGQPAVRLVFHREFMPAEALPCFSSPCIEMFLHRIPGLSETFIYGNDDMFPLSPLEPEDFFRPAADATGTVAGKPTADATGVVAAGATGVMATPCQQMTENPFPGRQPNIFQRKCMFQQNMVGKPFGKRFTTTWLKGGHSLVPILKSSCEEVWRRHGAEITANLSPIKRTDRSCNHYIYSLYQHFAGIAIEHAPKRRYLGVAVATKDIAAIIRDPDCGILCLNDNEKIADWQRRAAVVRKEIADKLSNT